MLTVDDMEAALDFLLRDADAELIARRLASLRKQPQGTGREHLRRQLEEGSANRGSMAEAIRRVAWWMAKIKAAPQRQKELMDLRLGIGTRDTRDQELEAMVRSPPKGGVTP